jgi:hypothetical protein
MAISVKTRVLLWTKAGGLCSNCRRQLVMSATATDDESLVGEGAHIVAEEDNGPRADPTRAPDDRNRYSNLVLLCRVCHKLVDDQVNTYTVSVLTRLKEAHERRVAEQLDQVSRERLDTLTIYAGYVEEWSQRADLDRWSKWTYDPMSDGVPRLMKDRYNELANLAEWLFTRIWPGTLPELEAAFANFRQVLSDFLTAFSRHREDRGDFYITAKFYQIPEWNKERYDRLAEDFDRHVDLVEDLVLELTRAANKVCDKVRQFLDPTFRHREGVLLASSGPYFPDMGSKLHKAMYGDKRTEGRTSYQGLEAFAAESEAYHEANDPDE